MRMPGLAAAVASAAVAAGYLYFFPFFAHLRNPNENVRAYTVIAVVEDHSFALNRIIARDGPVDDRATNLSQRCVGVAGAEPCTYSSKAPGVAYLGIPVYAALRLVEKAAGRQPDFVTTIYVLRLLCVILPSLAFLWAFWRFLDLYDTSPFDRLLIVSTLGLGTMCFTYTHVFAGHQLVAILAFGSFMLIEHARRTEEPGHVAAAGFAAAFAVITEYPAALVIPVLLVYVAVRMTQHRRTAVSLFVAGMIAPGLLGSLYHQVCFGRPWRTGYSMLANRAYAHFHSAGLFGIGRPSLTAAAYNLFSPARGLFFFSPFLLLGIPGLVLLWRERRRAEAALCASVVAIYVLYQSAVNPEIGGWSIGPRYIVLVVPFLAFGAAAFVRAARVRWVPLYLLAIPLSIVSIVYTFVSTIVFYTFPPAFTNPFYEWIVPLARMDYFNYSIGTFFGLRGLSSAWPGLVVIGVLVLIVLFGPSSFPAHRRFAGAAAAALVVSAWLTSFSHVQRFSSREKDGEFHRLVMLWEPPPASAADLDWARQEAAEHPDAAEAQRRLGMLLARRGEWPEALRRYAAAIDASRATR